MSSNNNKDKDNLDGLRNVVDEIENQQKQKQVISELEKAVVNNKTDTVRELLQNNTINVNQIVVDGLPLLLKVISQKTDSDMMSVFLQQPTMDVNIKDVNGKTPLMYALKKNKFSAAERLLTRDEQNVPENLKLNVNVQDNNGNTALMWATVKCVNVSEESIVNHLTKRKDLNVNLQNTAGMNALMQALRNNNIHMLKNLLNRDESSLPEHLKLNVNLQDVIERTALMNATMANRFHIVELLLNRDDVDVNLQDSSGKTALMLAVSLANAMNQNLQNDYPVITKLLQRPIDLNKVNTDGQTVVQMAEQNPSVYMLLSGTAATESKTGKNSNVPPKTIRPSQESKDNG